MWLLPVLFSVVSVICHGDEAERDYPSNVSTPKILRKCCGYDSVLSLRSIGHTSSSELVCLQNGNYSRSIYPLSLSGFGRAVHGFPDSCSAGDLVSVDLQALSHNACIDKLIANDKGEEDAVVGVKCKLDSSAGSQAKVTHVKKCCPKNKKYNPQNRACIQSSNAIQVESKLIEFVGGNSSEFVDFSVGVPKCLYSQSLVDFHTAVDGNWDSRTLCVDELAQSEQLGGRRCVSNSEICGLVPCVPKCCGAGRSMVGIKCSDTDRGFNPTFFDTTTTIPKEIAGPPQFAIVHGLKCKEGRYHLDPNKDSSHLFYVASNGSMLHLSGKRWFTLGEFCLEDVVHADRGMNGTYAFICFPERPPTIQAGIKFLLIPAGLIVSCVFLLATLIVYSCLPSLHGNLHGKTIMFLIVNYLAAFICLATVQMGSNDFSRPVCKVLSFCLLFTWLSSFAWLNVMCFEIWRTFGVMQHGTHGFREGRRLCLYALYAWGLPTIITTVALAMEHVDSLSPDAIKPRFGHKSCWFHKENHAELVFFILPSSAMLLGNLAFFILTLRWSLRVGADLRRMRGTVGNRTKEQYGADKNRFFTNCQLFFVMGLMWLFEFISGAFTESPNFWILFDIINVLQGVLIFAIFVMKRRVLHELAARMRVPCCRMETQSAATTTNVSVANQELRTVDSVHEELL